MTEPRFYVWAITGYSESRSVLGTVFTILDRAYIHREVAVINLTKRRDGRWPARRHHVNRAYVERRCAELNALYG